MASILSFFKSEFFRNAFCFLFLGVASVYIFWTTLLVCTVGGCSGLFWDQWENVSAFFRASDSNQLLGWITRFHNEHRIVVHQVLAYFDWRWFGAKNDLMIAWIFFNQLGFALLAGKMGRELRGDKGLSLLWILASIPLLFSASQIENLSWGFQVQFVNVFLFGFLGIYLNEKSIEKKSVGLLLGAAVFATLASFSMANGMLVWPLLVASHLIRRNWKVGGIVALLFSLNVFVFRSFPAGVSSSTSIFSRLADCNFLDCLEFLLLYLGNPIGRFDLRLAQLFSAFLLVHFFILGFYVWKFERKGIFISLFLFGLFLFGTGMMTAVGRSSLGIIQATAGRYNTPALFFICVCILLTYGVLKSEKCPKWICFEGRFWIAVFFAFYGYLLFNQTAYVEDHSINVENRRIALNAIQNDSVDDIYLNAVHPNMRGHTETVHRLKSDFHFKGLYGLQAPDEAGDFDRPHSQLKVGALYFYETDSFSGSRKSGVVFGEIKGVGFKKSEVFHFVDEAGECVGSGIFVSSFLDDWPMSELKTDPDSQLFYGHIRSITMLDGGRIAYRRKDEYWMSDPLLVNRVFKQDVYRRFDISFYNSDKVDLQVIEADSAWSHDGTYPSEVHPSTFTHVYGSWTGADSNVGSILFEFENGAEVTRFLVPYTTGPNSPNALVEIIDQESGQVLVEYRPKSSPDHWSLMEVILPYSPAVVQIRVTENGTGWGQWLGIADPCLVVESSER